MNMNNLNISNPRHPLLLYSCYKILGFLFFQSARLLTLCIEESRTVLLFLFGTSDTNIFAKTNPNNDDSTGPDLLGRNSRLCFQMVPTNVNYICKRKSTSSNKVNKLSPVIFLFDPYNGSVSLRTFWVGTDSEESL